MGAGQVIMDLFQSRIGPIRGVQFFGNENNPSMEVTFSNPDDAAKSLGMSGYIVLGQQIIVTSAARLPPKPRAPIQAGCPVMPDNRRNLYVLGLPFDSSETELSTIFSRYGTVTHSVILATVDNASRRRGFVVMRTHDQAKAAMDNISQTNIRGSIVDVSWAVVQRSLVFLMGEIEPLLWKANALSDNPKTINSLAGAQPGPASIVVHNLPAFLFAQESDLEPLFYPFGEVKEIRKQAPSWATQTRGNTISVLVTYSSVTGAREAKVVLHGQIYGDTPLIVESFPSLPNHEANWKPGPGHLSRSSLNPCASPFVLNTASALSAPPTCNFSGDFPDYFSKPKWSGLARPSNHFSPPKPAPQGYRSLPASRLPSRPNSTASWSARLHV
ncbi:hypothetical protein BC826DRAFT_1174998 [Russula brevipes]|nr:hypothetical protein BC826DRAFT_1174998 [Russula brevipes]